MGETDRAPGEEVREAGKSEQPGEDIGTALGLVDVGQASKEESKANCEVGATMLIDLLEEGRTHSLGAQSLDGTGRTVRAGVCDGDDRDRDDSIKDRGENLDTSELEGADERRVSGVSTRSRGEVGVVGRNNETQEEERDDVEQGDTPEHLLRSLGDGLSRVGRFCGGETNQLGSTESKGGSDEH